MGSADPVLSLLKDFSYNVVRLPRTGIRPLQILEKQGNDLVVLGEVPDLFRAGAALLPPVSADEQAAFINGKRTRDLTISVGLSLLGNIIGAMTGTKVKLDLGYKRASALAFEFHDVKVNGVNQLQLSKFLTAASIDETVGPPAKLLEADKLYLITSTVKSTKFTAEALKSGGVSVDVDVPVIKAVVSGAVGVKSENASNSKITYEGSAPLVFGFQAVRMEFEQGRFKGFKQVNVGEGGLRGIANAPKEPQYEMLTTGDAPFANLINPLPDSSVRRAGKKSSAAKPSAKKRVVKKIAAKKKPTTKKKTTTKKKAAAKKKSAGKKSAGKKSAPRGGRR